MRLIVFVFVLLYSSQLHAQWMCNDTTGYDYGLDTNNFDNVQTAHFKIAIDTADTANVWAVGSVLKSGFPQPLNGVNAIQTDTANPYPININSQFIVWRDTSANFFEPAHPFSLSFWHYYNVDSLTDSCIVQATVDTGKTWRDINGGLNISAYFVDYYGSLSNTLMDPNHMQMLLFTGSSGMWVREHICFYGLAVKSTSSSINNGFGFRFLFKSDTVETNKPGWVIDDIEMIEPRFYGGISDVGSNPLSVYPNPSSTGVYTLSFPERFVKGTIAIYDVFGRRLKILPLQKQIDLSDMPPGIYQYRASFNGYKQVYSGKLVRE